MPSPPPAPSATAPGDGSLPDRPETLADAAALAADCQALAAADPRFAPALTLTDRFPFQARPPGFATMVQIVLEQQVSVSAARALWQRLLDSLGEPTPDLLLAASEETLAECGFSRQKRRYAWALATAVAEGAFDPGVLDTLDDEAVRKAILALPGFGPWSADCYLLFALRRRDILPAGDLALQVAWAHLAGLPDRPTPDALTTATAEFAPRRTAVSYLLWRTYLAWLAPGRRQA